MSARVRVSVSASVRVRVWVSVRVRVALLLVVQCADRAGASEGGHVGGRGGEVAGERRKRLAHVQ